MEFRWFDLLYLLNLFCVWFSWRVARSSFETDNPIGGWINVFASALNAAVILDHFI